MTDPVAALRNGEADVINVGGRPDLVPTFRRNRDVRILTVPSAAMEQLAIRVGAGGHPALKSRLVRRALAYGIDRAAIVRDLYAEIATGLKPLDSAVLFANDAYYRPNWSRYGHRPDEARRLLERAGCRPGGDAVRYCFGERLSLRFVTTAGNPRRDRTLQLLQAQLGRIGIEVVREYASPGVLFFPGGILDRGAFDVALFATVGSDGEPPGVDRFLCDSGNFTGHCDRLLNRDLKQVPLALDAEKRAALLNDADRKLADTVPIIPLYQPPNLIAVRKSVVGMTANPLAGRVTYRAEDWWLSLGR